MKKYEKMLSEKIFYIFLHYQAKDLLIYLYMSKISVTAINTLLINLPYLTAYKTHLCIRRTPVSAGKIKKKLLILKIM